MNQVFETVQKDIDTSKDTCFNINEFGSLGTFKDMGVGARDTEKFIASCSTFIKKLMKPIKKDSLEDYGYKLSMSLKGVPKRIDEHLSIPDSKVYNPSTILFSMIWLYITMRNGGVLDCIKKEDKTGYSKLKFIYLWCRFIQQIPDGHNLFFGNTVCASKNNGINVKKKCAFHTFITPIF